MNNKEKKLISAVIYLYNNEQVIVSFIKKIALELDTNFENFEIIVVNDSSSDSSVDKIKQDVEIKEHKISIVQMSFHQGIELSMNAGVDLAIGDFVYEFDDLYLDYDLNLIFESYKKLISGFDIVTVSPTKSNSLVSNLFYKIYNYFSSNGYEIGSDRFRILSRRSINRAYSISKTIPYRKALYANSGLKIDVIKYEPKKYETKTVNLFKNKMAINALIIYTNLAFKISIGITLMLFLFTLGTVFYTVIVFFSDQKPIEGWTTLMIVLSASFSGLFFLIAIVIKYLSLIVELIYTKKVYLFENVEPL